MSLRRGRDRLLAALSPDVVAAVEQLVRDEIARYAPVWEWLTLRQAAELLGVTPKAVDSKYRRGVLQAHKFDGHLYLSRHEIDRAIRERSATLGQASVQ